MRIKTGIEGLDIAMKGGLVKNSIVLLSGGSGTGKTIIAAEFLNNGALNEGENGLFITLEEGRANIINNLPANMKKTVMENEDKIMFLDLSTMRRLTDSDTEKGHAPGVLKVEVLVEIIEAWVNEKGVKRLAIDGIASFGLYYGCENEFRNAMFRLVSLLKNLDVTTIITTEINEANKISRLGVEEFVTDAIIRLKYDGGARRLEILKMRGGSFLPCCHSYEISDSGVSVYPRVPPDTEIPQSSSKIATGISGLDRMSEGGFHKGDAILVSGSAGTGKTTLGLQFLDEGARQGKMGLFIGFEESPEELKRNAANIGVDLVGHISNGLIKIIYNNPAWLEKNKHSDEIRRSLGGVERVVIDTLTDYETTLVGKEYREFLTTLIMLFKKMGITCILTSETSELMGTTKLASEGTSYVVDGIIMMRYVEIGSEMKRAMNILKLRGTTHARDIKQYEITDRGIVIESKFVGMEGVMTGSPRKSITESVEKFFG